MTQSERATGSATSVQELRAVDLFDDLSDAELAEWVALASVRQLEPGEVIAEQAEEPPGLQLLLEGDAQTLMFEHGRPEPVGRQHAPTWMGAIKATRQRVSACIRTPSGAPVITAIAPIQVGACWRPTGSGRPCSNITD